jgi:hypothetical protein
MITLATTFSRHIRRPGGAYETYSRPSYMKRLCYLIETSDWDEQILIHEEWINKLCVGLIITAVLYFVPFVVNVFLR